MAIIAHMLVGFQPWVYGWSRARHQRTDLAEYNENCKTEESKTLRRTPVNLRQDWLPVDAG
jgi:hypothetical protein